MVYARKSERAEKQKYSMWYKCDNCGHEATREIEMGTKAYPSQECKNCGCKEFQPKPSKKPPVG
jgi:DNA-directed RNA polymerase subunit RPC12/RpoP